jgi:hypothetical protein
MQLLWAAGSGGTTVHELARLTGACLDTVRRDLRVLRAEPHSPIVRQMRIDHTVRYRVTHCPTCHTRSGAPTYV